MKEKILKQQCLKNLKRIVIKIGSALLTNGKSVNQKTLYPYIKLISQLRKKNIEVILVSSGAVAMAYEQILTTEKQVGQDLTLRQAMASVGQVTLMNLYRKEFKKKKITIGQILFSKDSLEIKKSSLNAKKTINKLLKLNILPIINENDALATDELKFGDNDLLGALTAQLVGADLYLILSDVRGVFVDYKQENQTLVEVITTLSKKIKQSLKTSINPLGTGGMKTKIKAARLIQKHIPTLITTGKNKNLYKNIFIKLEGSLFIAFEKIR